MKLIALLLLISVSIVSCEKEPTTTDSTLTLSPQWQTIDIFAWMYTPTDGQWKNTSFTNEEMNLFTSLDTSDLTSTAVPSTTPATIISKFGLNPIDTATSIAGLTGLRFTLEAGFSGDLVCKYVIVDSLMNPVEKASFHLAEKLFITNYSYHYSYIYTQIPTGRYRFYYTLSALSNEHFFKGWGNITKL